MVESGGGVFGLLDRGRAAQDRIAQAVGHGPLQHLPIGFDRDCAEQLEKVLLLDRGDSEAGMVGQDQLLKADAVGHYGWLCLQNYRTSSSWRAVTTDKKEGGIQLERVFMSVTVDQELLAAEELGLATVGQVLAHLQSDDRLVVNLLIDGQQPDLQ